jgi:hypothetical protein
MEYLRKLGQFQRSSNGSGQNPSFPASSYSPNALDYLDQLDQARLQQAMMPNLPKTLGSDPASMIERQFRQYQEKRQREAIPTKRSAETRGARPPANYDPLSSVQTKPRPVQPITPPSMGAPPSTGNVPLPVRPQTSATQSQSVPAQGGGLLDVDTDFFDDPTRMGLLQAGLGLMSAPRYSTNPNDVTLSSALARGLGGYIQGYGGTKKRLSEAERQKLEDEYRKSERDFNKMYKEVMMDDAKSRIDERRGLTSDRVREKAEEKNLIDTMVNEILRAEGKTDNKTRKINLTTLARQDRDRFNELHQNATTDRTPFEQILIESGRFTKEQAEAQPLSLLMQNAETISGQQANPPKPETKKLGEADERMFDSLNKGKRGDIPLGDPEYVNAYTRYYEKYLRPKTYPDGSSYLPTSQFDAPPDFKTAAVMGQGDLVSQVNTPGGSLIKRMDQKDKDAVRNLTSNISQLEEYENILSKIDINNLDRISQTSPEIADLQTLFKNLQLRLKDNPYGLGALTGPDMGLMEAILSDPTKADIMDWRAYLQNRPFYLAQANRLKKILVQDADSIYSDYSTSLADEFQRKNNRPLNWLEQEPTAKFRLSTRSEDILAEEEPAVSPMTNNGNESSFFDPLINILPDAIQNLGR